MTTFGRIASQTRPGEVATCSPTSVVVKGSLIALRLFLGSSPRSFDITASYASGQGTSAGLASPIRIRGNPQFLRREHCGGMRGTVPIRSSPGAEKGDVVRKGSSADHWELAYGVRRPASIDIVHEPLPGLLKRCAPSHDSRRCARLFLGEFACRM